MAAVPDFARKLQLAMKAFNLSRGRLAQLVGIDKSVVSRWVSGATVPTDNNLALLTQAIIRHKPDFSRLAWDLEPDAFAARLGVEQQATPSPAAPAMPSLGQKIRTCRSADGVQIAWSVIGSGPPLVKVGNWMTHLEKDVDSPIWRPLWQDLTRDHSLVRYDARGNGLSDWDVEEITFDGFVRDLTAVVDAAGLERFALLGISQGCAVAVAYAAANPDRVSRMVLYGGYAEGWNAPTRSAQSKQEHRAMLTLMRLGWGQENPAFRQLFTSQFLPQGTKEQVDWFNDLQRISASPENAARTLIANGEVDIVDLLPTVKTPALVMHARGDARVPFEAGRRLGEGLGKARFVPLDGVNHMFLQSEPAYARFLAETRAFLSAP